MKKVKWDVWMENHGSIWLARMMTPLASEWAMVNIQKDATWLGNAVGVEPRYVEGLVKGMMMDGLKVRMGG